MKESSQTIDPKTLFGRMYHLYTSDPFPPRKAKGELIPYIFSTTEFGLEVDVNLSTVPSDIRHEEDDYAHALRYAALPYLDNLEADLSVLFHEAFCEELRKQGKYFDDIRELVFPYEVYAKSSGGLRRLIQSSFTGKSEFSYRHDICSYYANRKKQEMYLVYEGKTLLEETFFKDLVTRIEEDFVRLSDIYACYAKEVLEPIYQVADKLVTRWKDKDEAYLKQCASIASALDDALKPEAIREYVRKHLN